MKKIDKLIMSSFVGPFVIAFCFVVFILVLQFLWLYIDEIAGKGVNILVMMELIGYMSVSTFPMALPVAVLIASVMVYGNMAERYELSSIKSAGISLLRSMVGLLFVAAGVTVFSYICSDFIIPISNLKFKSRLYDIRRQKPALTIEKGVFNEDFRQFAIRVGDKERDGETIGDVMIEDQSSMGRLRFNQILADSGQMFTTRDKRFFVMNLFRGVQYQEPSNAGPPTQAKYPFVRTSFKSWTKVWDMKEFEMTASDEDRFKSGRTQLSMAQLRQNVDSLQKTIDGSRQTLTEDLVSNLKRIPAPATSPTPPPTPAPPPKVTTKAASSTSAFQKKAAGISNIGPSVQRTDAIAEAEKNASLARQKIDKPLSEYNSFLETFPEHVRESFKQDAINRARGAITILESRELQISNRKKEQVKTAYELYSKYSFALVCFLFLFVGAPMGAIIRKGGFGYPILISIIFFVIFIVLSITSRKFAELYYMTPLGAAMVPCMVIAPIGVWLTYRAMNDISLFSTDRIDRFLFRLRNRWQNRQPQAANPS
jgi:lipopolysaccharide export system permease protein